jgi:hypothetical protein
VHNFDSAESLSTARIQKTKSYFDRLEAQEPEPAPPAAREGLPPTYRMRADPHYVDLLASRVSSGRERMLPASSIEAPAPDDPASIMALVESVKHHGMLQPLLVQERDGAHRLIAGRKRLSAALAAGLRDVPCLVFDVDDAEAARLADAANVTAHRETPRAREHDTSLHGGADLAQSLATLGACADLLAGSQTELSRAVTGNLIRAEVWRAGSLLHATRIVRQETPVVKTATNVLGVVDRVAQGFLPERQVRALTLQTVSPVPHGTFIAADERMLIAALSGAVMATVAVLGNVRDASMTIQTIAEPAGHVTFEVVQEIAVVPDVWSARAFDQTWTDRPGGATAAISMLAIRCTADAHGGAARVTAGARGTRIAFAIPTGL